MEKRIEKDVFVPKLTPSLNITLNWHWREKARQNKGWLRDLSWFFAPRNRVKAFREMAIISYRAGQVPLDDDNLRGGCKGLVDALKKLGWIWDDGAKWMHCEYGQRKVGADGTIETGTRIMLYREG